MKSILHSFKIVLAFIYEYVKNGWMKCKISIFKVKIYRKHTFTVTCII